MTVGSNDELYQYFGHDNLESVSQMARFNDWMYKQVSPALKGDVLEVGSGIGTFSEKIVSDLPHSQITLTDISPFYLKELEKRFSGNSNISVCKLDLNCKTDYDLVGYAKFDSILATNVLEHIENDVFALRQLYKMLKKDGMLIALVPCHKFLYNVIDTNVGHFRRYTKKDLEFKIRKTHFTIDRIFYFNIVGIIGWYVNGSLAKNPKIDGIAPKIFDRLVPVLAYIERLLHKKIGLSIVCYLKKSS
jgi:SAM-dependent methyltransferase